MFGLLPPSSSVTRFSGSPASRMISAPVLVEPVNATLSTPGWRTRYAPVDGPSPGTMLTTPSGNPTSVSRSASSLRFATIASESACSRRDRSVGGVFAHGPASAVPAASTARSTSASPAIATRASGSPVAGSVSSRISPEAGSTRAPPMNSPYSRCVATAIPRDDSELAREPDAGGDRRELPSGGEQDDGGHVAAQPALGARGQRTAAAREAVRSADVGDVRKHATRGHAGHADKDAIRLGRSSRQSRDRPANRAADAAGSTRADQAAALRQLVADPRVPHRSRARIPRRHCEAGASGRAQGPPIRRLDDHEPTARNELHGVRDGAGDDAARGDRSRHAIAAACVATQRPDSVPAVDEGRVARRHRDLAERDA